MRVLLLPMRILPHLQFLMLGLMEPTVYEFFIRFIHFHAKRK